MKRDDIIEYSLDAHHSEEEGKKIRKKIFFVAGILSVITVIEVLLGVLFGKSIVGAESQAWTIIKLFFIILTILKAAYIVMIFMHLGDERPALRWIILSPYALFIIYLAYIVLLEGTSMIGA